MLLIQEIWNTINIIQRRYKMNEMKNAGAKLLTALIAMICMTSIAAGASVSVDSRDVSLGDIFTIDVTVNPEGEVVYSAQYDMEFNPAILQVTDQDTGGFLTQDGENSIPVKNAYNNTIGKIEYGETRMGVTFGVTGAGVLATITFEAVSAGSTDLVFSNVVVGDPSAQPIEGVVLNNGKVNVTGEPQDPQLCTDPDPPTHDFGSVTEGETRTWTFDITNCGGGTLDWTVSGDQSWITVNPAGESTTTETDTVTVTIDTTGLSDGTHTGTVTVSSEYGTKAGMIIVDVTTSPQAPTMSVDSRDVAPGDTFTIDVTVDPAGEVVYSAQYDLTFNPSILQVVNQEKGGFLTQDGESSIEVKNTFNNTIGKLEYGETRMGVTSDVTDTGVLATITFEAVSAGSTDLVLSNVVVGDTSAQPIEGVLLKNGKVNVHGDPQDPLLCTTPDPPSHDFGSVPEGETQTWQFDVTNCGSAGTLTWTASDDQTWIRVSPTSGTDAGTVTVTINTTGLSDGTHTGIVTVASDHGTETGTITVDVQSTQVDPKLCANPEHNFGTVQPDQTETWQFDVTNCGSAGTLTWTASDDQTWIRVSPTSGTDAGTVTVTINTASLTPGTHTGTVTVESNGGTKTGTITVNVKGSQPPPSPPPTSAEVPTFTPIGMFALVGLLGIAGIGVIKRR